MKKSTRRFYLLFSGRMHLRATIAHTLTHKCTSALTLRVDIYRLHEMCVHTIEDQTTQNRRTTKSRGETEAENEGASERTELVSFNKTTRITWRKHKCSLVPERRTHEQVISVAAAAAAAPSSSSSSASFLVSVPGLCRCYSFPKILKDREIPRRNSWLVVFTSN